MADTLSVAIPRVSAGDTVDAIVAASKRRGYFPVRSEFVQRWVTNKPMPGPLSSLVSAGDLRALQLYLLLVTKACAPPWDSALPASAWARALDLPLPESRTARSTISKIWLRLERHGLVDRKRHERLADVFLLREDGSGTAYTSPGEVGERYLRVPLALWRDGPVGTGSRWYQELSLPELAVLLIARSLSDGFWLPQEKGPEWYGISADTISRGIVGLTKLGLLRVDKRFKKAPLSAVGYTAEHRYTLLAPFGPVGRKAGKRPQGKARPATAPASTSRRVRKVRKAPAT
jgi:hypothetical protein